MTLTFWRLGKVESGDALFYIVAQFFGGISRVLIIVAVLRPWVSVPSVNLAVTMPGDYGPYVAFVGEFVISFLLMRVILNTSNTASLARFTGLFAGTLVATYLTVEAPISGMSTNPAGTTGSAFSAHAWTAWWVYFTAPVFGMLLAAEVYLRARRECRSMRQVAAPEE